MVNLIFKILADASPWRKVVTQDLPKDAAKGGADAGSAAGKMFGAQMKSAILRYVGAGAILGTLTKQATEAANLLKESQQNDLGVEAWQELKKAMDETGLSLEDIRTMAKELPEDFDKMMTEIRNKGGILPKDQAEEMAEVKKHLDEAYAVAGKLFGLAWNIVKATGAGTDYLAGAAIGALGNVTGSEKLKKSGQALHDRGDVIMEGIAGVPQISTGLPSSAQTGRRNLKRLQQGNADWEAMGGNVDWSLQTREYNAKQQEKADEDQRKAMENFQREQLRELRGIRRGVE